MKTKREEVSREHRDGRQGHSAPPLRKTSVEKDRNFREIWRDLFTTVGLAGVALGIVFVLGRKIYAYSQRYDSFPPLTMGDAVSLVVNAVVFGVVGAMVIAPLIALVTLFVRWLFKE